MKVIRAKSAGFCWGVQRAVQRARDLARRAGALIYTDGPLIHNEQMMSQLRSEGIVEVATPGDAGDGVLLIRAHGIPPERRRALQALRAQLVDTTCPDVARIQGLIKVHAAKGRRILIFGDPAHAEVIGLIGFAAGMAQVVNGPSDIAAIPPEAPVCLVSQSTQFPADFQDIAEAVHQRFRDAVVLDTICASTKNRQNELIEIAQQVDAVVVVGGTHSANTHRLVDLARRYRPTFHIQTQAEIVPEPFQAFQTVGLTAGASTPEFVIDAVQRALEQIPYR